MKSVKIITIIGGIALVCGLILFGIGFAFAGFNFVNLSTEQEYAENTYEISAAEINTFVLDEANKGVTIVESYDDNIRITYFENDKYYYTINDQSSKLEFKLEYPKFNFGFNLFNGINDIYFEIAIPKHVNLDVDIENSNGSITIDTLDTQGDVKLKTSNSMLNLSQITAESFYGKSSNGRIIGESLSIANDSEFITSNASVEISDATVGNAIFDTSNGRVTITDFTSKKDVDVKTSNDSIKLDEVTARNIITKTSNGKIELENTNAANKTSATSSNSGIMLDSIKCGKELDLKTSNGRIEGTIDDKITNFTIDSKTSNGDNNLPSQAFGDKLLYAKTSNSKIDIVFLQE